MSRLAFIFLGIISFVLILTIAPLALAEDGSCDMGYTCADYECCNDTCGFRQCVRIPVQAGQRCDKTKCLCDKSRNLKCYNGYCVPENKACNPKDAFKTK